MHRYIALLIFLAGCCRVAAELHEVHPGESIQVAVLLAADFDTVLVHEGVYYESVVVYGRTLTIGSSYLLDQDTNHVAATVVSGIFSRPDTGSAFAYCYGEESGSALVGLSLTGQQGTWWPRSSPPAYVGGALYVSNSTVRVDHCHISFGVASYGGGIHISGEPFTTHTYVELLSSKVTDCYSFNYGGGVYAIDCSLRVVDCEIARDTSATYCGGMAILQSWLTLHSSSIRQCYGSIGGVGVGASGIIDKCLFEENGSPPPGDSHFSHSDNYNLTVVRCIFRANSMPTKSLALAGQTIPIRFFGNIVEDNLATPYGGTVSVTAWSRGDIAYNIFRNNTNSNAGAIIALNHALPRIHHNYFTGNEVQNANYGSVLQSNTSARPTFDSNWVAGNFGQSISIQADYPVTIDARHNWWGHESGPYHPTRNPSGQGDTLLSDSVMFFPFLTSPPDTSLPDDLSTPSRRVPAITRTWELIEVYPNPFNSTLSIVLAGFTSADFSLSLYNLLGQQVAEVVRGELIGNSYSWNAPPSLSTGIYFLVASDRENRVSKKVMLLK